MQPSSGCDISALYSSIPAYVKIMCAGMLFNLPFTACRHGTVDNVLAAAQLRGTLDIAHCKHDGCVMYRQNEEYGVIHRGRVDDREM